MDDYEIGQVYTFRGTPYQYRGGDPADRASWRRLSADAAVPAVSRQYDPGALSDFMRATRQGLTFGFGDEIAGLMAAITPGGQGYTEARDASRDRLERMREERPGVSLAGELLGGLMLPAGAAGSLLRAGAGVGRSALTGAAAGGLTGGLFGLGEAKGTPGERIGQAVGPAVGGAGLGGVGGAVGALFGKAAAAANRVRGAGGPRVARDMERLSGMENDIRGAFRTTKAEQNRISAQVYQPLESKYAAVESPNLVATLRAPEVAGYVRSVAPEVFAGRPPSFRELQAIRTAIRRSTKRKGEEHLAAEITREMQAAIPELADADHAYWLVNRQLDALRLGRRNARRSEADIRMELDKLPEEAHGNFRRGMLHEHVRGLLQLNKGSAGAIKRFTDAGPENKAVLRTLFPDESAYEEFMTVLHRERRADRIATVFRRLAIGGVAAAAIGGAGAVGFNAVDNAVR